ncbi:hypothetical protein MUK42_03061 [Musa troglodytarum]|uniref:Uncharacterized protein n=1 Tax=Musa troglodytarum TaxID=320322 RepID=A0A9E7EKB2_9LILI|nr:hypothetical protein MUK42_03061 [Musa troglodytarum]
MERQQKSTGGRRLRHEPRGTNSVLLFLHQEPFRPLHLGSGNVTRRDPPSAASGGEDSVAIAESYASSSPLSASLSPRSRNLVTSTSIENMQCFNDVVGRLQESGKGQVCFLIKLASTMTNLLLMPHNKGNRYINSCLRLNEEMKSLESLAMQFSPKDIVMEVHKKDIMNCGS